MEAKKSKSIKKRPGFGPAAQPFNPFSQLVKDSNMKIGDLVEGFEASDIMGCYGIIIEVERNETTSDLYRVLWRDGTLRSHFSSQILPTLDGY